MTETVSKEEFDDFKRIVADKFNSLIDIMKARHNPDWDSLRFDNDFDYSSFETPEIENASKDDRLDSDIETPETESKTFI